MASQYEQKPKLEDLESATENECSMDLKQKKLRRYNEEKTPTHYTVLFSSVHKTINPPPTKKKL